MPGPRSEPALDTTDLAILDVLVVDARATYGDIGAEVGLSAPAVKRRMDRLVSAGVIRRYTVDLDHERLGRPLEAFTELRFSGNARVDVIAAIGADIPEVQRVFTMAGDPDALVWLRVRDVRDLKRVVDRLRGAGDVTGTKTMIVLDASIRASTHGAGAGPRDRRGRAMTTVLAGGIVVDGRRRAPRRADVTISGDRIIAVGPSSSSDRAGDATSVVDVSGLVVAPGFIDAHSHADFTLPRHPGADVLLRQGCTTVVTGNCGFSPWPFPRADADAVDHGRFLDPLEGRRWPSLTAYAASLGTTGVGVNVAPLCGHGAVRTGIVGASDRPASPSELAAIARQCARALDDGAFGMSFGLSYPHGRYASPAELRAVADVVASRRAILSVHLRDEGPDLLDAVAEMEALAAAAGCAVQLSHHKAAGAAQRGLVQRSLGLVDAARDRGVAVTTDAYPYTMGATTLAAALPDWSTGNGDAELRRIARDPSARRRLVADLRRGANRFEPGEIWVAEASARWQHVTGAMLVDRAAELAIDPVDLLVDIVADDGMTASMMVFCMDPTDVRTVLRHPQTVIGSDGWVLTPTVGTHPRNYQTFPQMLARSFLDDVGLDLVEVVAKMTGDTAERFGIADRGALEPGSAGDVVVFDPERVGPGGGLADPGRPPDGIEMVFVNGAQGRHRWRRVHADRPRAAPRREIPRRAMNVVTMIATRGSGMPSGVCLLTQAS